jgi:hypothetical protein
MYDGIAPDWRQVIDRHQTALADELTAQLDAEIRSSVESAVATERERASVESARALEVERERASAESARALEAERSRANEALSGAVEDARRRLSETLNQALRRIRQTTAEHEALQSLLEDSAFCAERAVVLLIENNQASVAAWRGVEFADGGIGEGAGGEGDQTGGEENLTVIETREAPAIAFCLDSRDPLVALASPSEISPVLAAALSPGSVEKVYLFPIAVRQTTVAMILAAGQVSSASMELLCGAVGMKLESIEEPVAAPVPSATPLVQISGSGSSVGGARSAATATSWTSLSSEEQALHLRAQRTAKVRVAQIRISEPDALRKGIQSANIYGAVRPSIDAARADYQVFMSMTPTMVDYLHLEIVRSLAREDTRLLGQDYPGPIA